MNEIIKSIIHVKRLKKW